MKSTRIVAILLTFAVPCAAYSQQPKKSRSHSRTIEGTVIGDVGGNAHWQWIEIESVGKRYMVGLQYNDGQGTNPKIIGGDCCSSGTRVRVTYIGREYDMLKATSIVILDRRTTAAPPNVSAPPRRTQDAELNIGTINNIEKYSDGPCFCWFKPPLASKQSESYIFSVDVNNQPYRVWLNIDGRVTALKLVSSTLKNNQPQKKGSGYTETYRSGDVTARITYVVVRNYPEGADYTATVVVTKGNRVKTVKAVGECGC